MSSEPAAGQSNFLEEIDGAVQLRADLDREGTIETNIFYELRNAVHALWYVFFADCRDSEAYSVLQKPAHNLATLLHNGELLVHQDIRPVVPALALKELNAAGRCLALEAFTAAGFHALRAVEVVVHEYYTLISGKDRELRSWYDYIQALTDLEDSREIRKSPYPSPKASAMIDRMRLLDRNPLMHPRESLDEMGADLLLSLCILTITELAKDLRDMRPQPVAVPDEQTDGQAKQG